MDEFTVKSINVKDAKVLKHSSCQYCNQTLRLAKKYKMNVLIDVRSNDLIGLAPLEQPTKGDFYGTGLPYSLYGKK